MAQSIKTRIMMSTVGLVLSVSLTMGILSVLLMKSYLRSVQREKLEFIATEKSRSLQQNLSSHMTLMGRVADGREIIVYKTKYNNYILQEHFAKFMDKFPILSYVNEQGMEEVKLVRGNTMLEFSDVSGSDIFRMAMKKPNSVVISPVIHYNVLGGPTIDIAVAKYGYFGNEFLGVIIGAVPIAGLTSDISALKIGNTGYCSVIDSERVYVVPPVEDYVMKKSGPDGLEPGPVISAAAAGKTGFGRTVLAGKDSFVAYAPVQETGWSVLAVLPYDEFISAPNVLRNTSIAIFIVVLAVALIISLVISKNISRPLSSLVDAARAIAKGDLTRTVTVTSKDEAGTLAAAFNEMTASLKSSREDLNAALEREKHNAEELKKAYIKLKDAQSMLIQAEKLSALGEMGAGMAHELNNPLAGILSLTRTMMIDKDPQSEEYDDLKDIEEACKHMARIIHDFGTFTRKSTGEITEVNIIDVIESTLSFAVPQLLKKGIAVEKYYEDNLPSVKGDIGQLRQVVFNLVANARDSITKKGTLKISTRSADNNVEIIFTDTGCGISRENIAKIFDPFYTTKRPGKGIGLGLSISHTIIKNHNGEILVESEPGQGTTFIIRLPAWNAEDRELPVNA